MTDTPQLSPTTPPSIKVVGVGGAGCKVLDRLIASGTPGITCIAVDTDARALAKCKAPVKLHLGNARNKEKGTLGDLMAIVDALLGADLILLAAGLGGDTGTGTSITISDIAKGIGLTLAIVSLPFAFQGTDRRLSAANATDMLTRSADSVIAMECTELLRGVENRIMHGPVFAETNELLCQGIQSIVAPLTTPGPVILGFAALRYVLLASHRTSFAIGRASGIGRVTRATRHALDHPLSTGRSGPVCQVLITITGKDYTSLDVNVARAIARETLQPNGPIIVGTTIDDRLGDKIQVSVLITTENWRPPFPPGEGSVCPAIPPHGSPRHDAIELPLPEPERPLVEAVGQWLREQRRLEPL